MNRAVHHSFWPSDHTPMPTRLTPGSIRLARCPALAIQTAWTAAVRAWLWRRTTSSSAASSEVAPSAEAAVGARPTSSAVHTTTATVTTSARTVQAEWAAVGMPGTFTGPAAVPY